MEKKQILYYLLTIIVLGAIATVLIGKYYLGWFDEENNDVYAKYIPQEQTNQENNLQPINNKLPEKNNDLNNQINKTITNNKENEKEERINNQINKVTTNNKEEKEEKINKPKIIENTKKQKNEQKNITRKSEPKKETKTKIEPPVVKKQEVFRYDDREIYFDFSKQPFHSLGEYVSDEEKKYRKELINNLTLYNIVIDKLSKGNGISQEFFKIAYETNMIPAKVLKDIVESEEFRKLIPESYLLKEGQTPNDLKNGEKVTFNGETIKDLLLLWSEGKLTPVQKAWIVGSKKGVN